MRQIQSCTPFSSSSLLSSLTNKTDRPWLSFSSAALVKTATPLMWPKEGAWALFHFAITDSPLCNNFHYYHRWSIIMISLLWSLQKIVTCSSKWAACSPRRRRKEVACNHLDMSRGYFSPLLRIIETKMPSEMEVAPHYTLLTLLIFTIKTALHCTLCTRVLWKI